jgi:hypothetical protein
VLALGASGSVVASADEGPRSVRVGTSEVAGLRVEPSARCAEQVRAELLAGQRRNDACGQDREAVGRAVVHRRDAFGFVEQREVDLASLRMVLGEARRCRQWPLRSPSRDVLRRTDVAAAGCRLRRYQGEVPVVLVDREGRRREPLPPMRTDRDGRMELRFAELDHALRVLGEGTLDGYTRIELGNDGWAGHVDLEQLLRFRADWHLSWLLRGRGAAGLFAVRHPDHPGADDARTLAAEALLERQARDYERVEAGELSPRAFLDRHPRSPYGRRVESRLRARSTTRSTAAQPEVGSPGMTGASAGEGSEAGADSKTGGATAVPAGGGRRGGTSGGSGP